MRKRIAFMLFVLAIAALGTAYGAAMPKDGVYFAQDKDFAPQGGWKEQVVVTVAGGKITAVNWNGVSNLGVADKKTAAAAGAYGMKKASKVGLEWHEQAAKVEAYLVKTQDTGFSKFKADGTTDAISGASLHVKNFYDLVNRALAAGPVAKGSCRKDGWFFAAQPDFDAKTGWKDSVLVTVVNGTLVEAIAGTYGMAKAAKLGEWNVQAAAVQGSLLKVQDPAKIPL